MLWLFYLYDRQETHFHERPWLVLIVIIHQKQSQNVQSVVNGLFDIIRAAHGLKGAPFWVCRCARSHSLCAGAHWAARQWTAALIY